MMQWGWRPISFMICICVWIVGCTDQHDSVPASTPTLIPQITRMIPLPRSATADADPALTPRLTPQPTPSTPALPDRSLATLTTLQSQPNRISLLLTPPTCYESHPGGILCFGLVHNPNDFPVRHVTITARLMDQQGAVLRALVIPVSQWIIPPGQPATYRLLFPPRERLYLADDFAGVTVEISEAVVYEGEPDLLDASAQVLDTAWVGDQYLLHVAITNRDTQDAEQVRLTVTLFDQAKRITGYRTIESSLLPAGESQTRAITVDTQITGQPLTHTLHVEAVR